ncbi:MAG: hypothetical protein HY301_01300 [Verrucomicrobia bacterium]|nr:hypothetical protein [Verrucomicrobiota bacterium]
MKPNWSRAVRGWIALAACVSTLNLRAAVPETDRAAVVERTEGETVPVLKTKTVTYTNVTLRAISDTDLFISHPGGVLNIKLKEIEPDSLAEIDSVRSKLPRMGAKPKAEPVPSKFQLPELPAHWAMDFVVAGREIKLTPAMVAGLVLGLVVGWLFYGWCCYLICVKSVVNPGIVAWLPVLQIFPLLRAARLPWWWFLVSLVAAPVAHIVWSVNIVRVRKKSAWLTVMLILPVTSLLGFLYLAFSRSPTADEHRRMDATMNRPSAAAPTASEAIRFRVSGQS